MITEDDLRETLRSHEGLAPDAAPVAARIRTGIRARRRHRYAGAVAAAAATAVAVAVPTLVLTGPSGTSPAPAGAPPAAPVASGAAVRFHPLTVPFTVGWLPTGFHQDGLLDSEPGSALRTYESTGSGEQLAVQVWDTKLSGRPADEVLPFGRETVRRHVGGNVWVAVGGDRPTGVLNHVLASVDLRRGEPITFPFRLTWVPAGYRAAQSESGLHHWFGNSAGDTVRADPPLVGAGLSLNPPRTKVGDTVLTIGVSTEDGSFQDKGLQPTGTLLDRPSRYEESGGLAVLHVYGVGGMHIQVNAPTGALSRAALERVVRGLRLVDHPDRPADWTGQPLP